MLLSSKKTCWYRFFILAFLFHCNPFAEKDPCYREVKRDPVALGTDSIGRQLDEQYQYIKGHYTGTLIEVNGQGSVAFEAFIYTDSFRDALYYEKISEENCYIPPSLVPVLVDFSSEVEPSLNEEGVPARYYRQDRLVFLSVYERNTSQYWPEKVFKEIGDGAFELKAFDRDKQVRLNDLYYNSILSKTSE